MTAHEAVGINHHARGVPSCIDLERLGNGDLAMRAVIESGKRLIDRGLPVLILGETGTGKELLARALHAYSPRRKASLVALNCASIPENLIESELFGYSRGAFSGALSTGMTGKLVRAHRGTLFLDEIGDMPAAQQTRLLRVLSENEVTPLGAAHPIAVDAQLICATHQDLYELVAQGRFREDLYYRIAVGVLHLPPLRARSDRKALIDGILADDCSAGAEVLADGALELLMTHDWPGNLRQLCAALRYACAVKTGERIEVADLPADLLRARRPRSVVPASSDRPQRIDDLPRDHERERVLGALSERRWNITAAARDLGVCRASVYRKLKQLGIPHVRDCAA
jgi:transcriptional regulator of acetoin/glycerol metabolism